MDKSTAGRLEAYSQHARHDPVETTAAARAAFLDRFEREVDPEGKLDPKERARRAEYAKKHYFTKLSEKARAARRKKMGTSGRR
jgi:hypothetical protein